MPDQGSNTLIIHVLPTTYVLTREYQSVGWLAVGMLEHDVGVTWNAKQAKRFGDVLRQIRTDRGLSQEALAARAGITKNQVHLLEAGRTSRRQETGGHSNPQISTLDGLAEALGVTVSEMLNEIGM